MPSTDRPFVDAPIGDPAPARAFATHVAHELGLPAPRLLRVGMNASFRAGDLVVRIGRPTAAPERAVELASRLRAHGLAVPRSAGAPRHGPDGLVATVWEWIEPVDGPVDWSAVGRQIRRLHDLDPTDLVPDGYPCPRPDRFPWWDAEAMLAEVADLLDPAARHGIEQALARHASWRRTLGSDAVVCHGDVHPGNVLPTLDGVVLLDWDLLCRAPRAWDVGALGSLHERWGGDPSVMVDFTRGYGEDLTLDPRAAAYIELRLVAATLLRLRAGRHDPAAAAEAERRLRWWRGDPDAPSWVAQ